MTETLRLKHQSKQKLTDAERHKRFVETAKKVEAYDDENRFDQAFMNVASSKKNSTDPSQSAGKEGHRTDRSRERC
jgi:hypothetical protein